MGSGKIRAVLLGTTLLVSGCQTLDLDSLAVSEGVQKPVERSSINPAEESNPIKELVTLSLQSVEDGELKEASRYINLALKLDVTNPDLQFLNGLTYHLMGVAGDASKYRLAEQGYKQALKFNPGYLSARYQLGLLYMDQRRYSLARGHFAAVALHRGDDPAVLYSLAASSYYSRDPQTTEAALKRLMEVDPEAAKNPQVLKASALSLAAMDDRDGAKAFVSQYRNVVADAQSTKMLERRVNGWNAFYENDAKVLMAQFGQDDPYATPSDDPYGAPAEDPYGQPDGAAQDYGNEAGQDAAAGTEPDMVVVDVVLIGTQEDVRDSRGVNLLNGLQLQFGDPQAGTLAWGINTSRKNDWLESGLAESTQTITSMIGIPAVTYSLNIANSLDSNNQILAKPSLVAQAGQTSEFFSGTEILAAAVSGGNGDSVSVQKEVGVKLAVTPEILPNDRLRLHVVAERTFLTDPSNSVVFEFRLDTTKTNVNSTVTMKFGETLILGGLSERETSKSSDGVPGLMDVPGLKYFFSERVEREFERSILILMTPRRPQYTRRSAEDRAQIDATLSDLERDLERLEQRHKDWFTPRPTFNQIVDKLQGREFFEEFRVGDVQVQSWQQTKAARQSLAALKNRILAN
ncbi:type II and III secretion system protein [Magnetospira sp. QH-2]|uniref:type II and III secretion system protein n=1 Tax=Magnetospira sp. (strain QH-2) TaxID=1288970 RepID=UPI0003E81C13|nr:type II and III secretion system protein [Magnetospira sp. QH-2]CCQ74214.1 Bacterial type II secretory pathway component [Magnetospira sp. QH-2]